MPLEVKAAIMAVFFKSSSMAAKNPYVFSSVYISMPGAAGFMMAIATCTILGGWLRAFVARRFTPRILTWFLQLCGLVSNSLAVLYPDSTLPMLPGCVATPAFLGEALLAGCAEHLQASGEEHAWWGQQATLFGSAGVLGAPLLASVLVSSFSTINYFCFAVDALLTLVLFAFTMPKEHAVTPVGLSWSEMLKARTLRTARGCWMLSWSVLVGLDNAMWEIGLLVHNFYYGSPILLQVAVMSLLMAVPTYRPPLSDLVQREFSMSPRRVLLGLMTYAIIIRLCSFAWPSANYFMLAIIFGQGYKAALDHLRFMMWTSIGAKDEGPHIAAMEATIGAFVSVAAPYALLLADQFLGIPFIVNALVLLSPCTALFGVVGLYALALPRPQKPKKQ